jgi:citrate lyase subunit beta / citryl-CoA lyase
MTAERTGGRALWESLARARTLLYVPGNRPERFEKATLSGADHIVLDLEDAVAPDEKVKSRHNVHQWLLHGGRGLVRINGVGTPWHDEDVLMLRHVARAVVLPKTAAASDVAIATGRLAPGSAVIPILETASGIVAAGEICSQPGVVRVIFGAADLARELGVNHTDRSALAVARAEVVLASAAQQIAPPLDGATTSFSDEKALIADAEDAAAAGFGGKSCIHPVQVPVVRSIFVPSAEQLNWARGVLAAAASGSSSTPDGEFIGRPIVARARRLVESFEL